ncbi:YusW family protein [Geomicrobium sp. JCM 19039]|uniref:YusW family protein n=1 Tax=Geomicrobium sp. JCM 19039 TaxID=1460636 RepID=UPI00045F2FAA|nr:YusW family protein [Geomicrobium sp. JCM 19039]GAK12318.1 lipoprotein [Geomicrobium sp. JCM 19039]
MKKYNMASLSILIALGLVGCGGTDDGTVENEQPPMEESTPTEDEGMAGDETTGGWHESLSFEEFQLDVEYKSEEYEVDYDYNNGNPEAEIQDTRGGSNIQVAGDEALDQLASILPELDIDEQTSPDELVQAVVEAFDLDETYDELDVDVEFFNNEEIEAEEDQNQ